MPQPLIDMTGERYGRLTVVRLSERKTNQGKPLWVCRCDCGNEVEVPRKRLIEGSTKSCGCYRREFSREQHTTHGQSRDGNAHTRLFRIWTGMKDRCNNPKSKYYDKYGGRGITICREWELYSAFHRWASEHGYTDQLTIDRIDNDKGYSPDNCRWATYSEQENNRRNNVKYEVNGTVYTLAQLARKENTTRAKAHKKHKEELINGK